jgi:hypothetical protein
MKIALIGGIYNTDMKAQWIIVHKKDGILLVQENNEHQVTTAKHEIETFGTEKECLNRVDELNATISAELQSKETL